MDMRVVGGRPDGCLSAADRQRLQEIGPRWNDDIVAHRKIVLDIYGPLAGRADKSGIKVVRDLAYGSDARQRLDVFVPKDATNAPVLMFVHGGAFTRGSKSVDGEIYDNVLYWFARQGFVGVNVEYRLAPQARFPAGAEDVADATRWVVRSIAAYGGDSQRLVLMGHSAGGSHVATYLLDPNIGLDPHPSVRAAVLISARLRLECRSDNPNARNVAEYCGHDSSVLDHRSAVTHAHRCRWPVFIGIAEFENRHLDVYGLEFAHAVANACGRAPRIVQMPGHNHTSMVAHFNTGEEALGREILDFIRPALG